MVRFFFFSSSAGKGVIGFSCCRWLRSEFPNLSKVQRKCAVHRTLRRSSFYNDRLWSMSCKTPSLFRDDVGCVFRLWHWGSQGMLEKKSHHNINRTRRFGCSGGRETERRRQDPFHVYSVLLIAALVTEAVGSWGRAEWGHVASLWIWLCVQRSSGVGTGHGLPLSVPTMLERTKISLGALIRCHTQDNTVTKVEFCEDKSDIL